uniref:Uncharacterized protein n=1 Tax=Cacopsylla melanoneura TaxID=428564 RepID=A0A8D8XA39_9HEMI
MHFLPSPTVPTHLPSLLVVLYFISTFVEILLVSTFVVAEKSVKTFINEHIKIPSFLANANMFVFICSAFIKKSCFLTFVPKSKMFFTLDKMVWSSSLNHVAMFL